MREIRIERLMDGGHGCPRLHTGTDITGPVRIRMKGIDNGFVYETVTVAKAVGRSRQGTIRIPRSTGLEPGDVVAYTIERIDASDFARWLADDESRPWRDER